MGVDPVRQVLTQACFGVGVIGSPHTGDKDLGLGGGAAAGIGNRHGHAAVVDKELFSCPVVLAHDRVQFIAQLAIEMKALAVLISLGALGGRGTWSNRIFAKRASPISSGSGQARAAALARWI